jgi:hemolysin III
MEEVKISRSYTVKEEVLSSIVHGIGIVLGVVSLTLLVTLSAVYANVWAVISTAVFGASIILLYTASTVYHAIPNPVVKTKLKKLDHISIYYLIAGSYTPFVLVSMRGAIGWTIFGIIWGLAILGTILKLCLKNTSGTKVWSVGLYLGMGWMVAFASKRLFQLLPSSGLTFLILGGLFYTLGIFFYVWKSKKYTHAIWHLFVLLGTFMHFFAVLFSCVI